MQETITYDLLELSWWQNPWMWVILIACSLFVMVIGYLLVWWHQKRCALSVPEQILRELKKLQTVSFSSQDEQEAFYCAITDLLKKYILVQFNCSNLSMTEGEFVQALREVQAPPIFIDCAAAIFQQAILAKFAQILLSEELIRYYLQTLILCIESYQQQTLELQNKQA